MPTKIVFFSFCCTFIFGILHKINLLQKLLLMAVTYRLCSIFSASFQKEGKEMRHKIETFDMLVKLIEENFIRECTVAFYADQLCLTPKYLSVIVKSVCGKTVQQIASDLSFPNASSFGTFFKKHTGLSPKNYRMGAE